MEYLWNVFVLALPKSETQTLTKRIEPGWRLVELKQEKVEEDEDILEDINSIPRTDRLSPTQGVSHRQEGGPKLDTPMFILAPNLWERLPAVRWDLRPGSRGISIMRGLGACACTFNDRRFKCVSRVWSRRNVEEQSQSVPRKILAKTNKLPCPVEASLPETASNVNSVCPQSYRRCDSHLALKDPQTLDMICPLLLPSAPRLCTLSHYNNKHRRAKWQILPGTRRRTRRKCDLGGLDCHLVMCERELSVYLSFHYHDGHQV